MLFPSTLNKIAVRAAVRIIREKGVQAEAVEVRPGQWNVQSNTPKEAQLAFWNQFKKGE